MRSANVTPLGRLVLGVAFSLAGLAVIWFRVAIKESHDRWSAKDFPIGFGQMWSGKYTRGGLIFTYALIILFGLLLLTGGIVNIVGAIRAIAAP